MPAGNRSVLVIVDSRRVGARRDSEQTVFAALEHFGVAWEVLECADYMSVPPGYLAPRGAYVLAHDGAGAGVKPELAQQIAEGVAEGAGLLSFDREIEAWPPALRDIAPRVVGKRDVQSVRVGERGSFITFGHEPGEAVELSAPIGVSVLGADKAWELLVGSADAEVLAVRGSVGQGRVVVFGTGERLWDEAVYGHARGIDGLMWRSLVWCAAKPFPMRCIPPYVSARMDDCNGTYGALAYVDVLNRHGISPNLGLFIDEMGPTDWAAAKRLYDQGGADFSMHAFRDDFYMARPDYKPYAVLADKPDLSNGGKETRFEGLSLCHITGRDLPDATVRRNFGRMDEAFSRAGIRHSHIINAHFGEVGWPAIPLFLERGADTSCNNSVFGQLYGNQPVWCPRPYAARGLSGRYGLAIDRCPYHPAMTVVSSMPSHTAATHMAGDILSGRVPFLGEAERPMLAEASAQGIRNVRLALDSLAFGVIMTHEERINAISPADWETVIEGIVRGVEDWEPQYTAREQISIICRRLLDTRLVRAELTEEGLLCELVGASDGPSPLTVWENEGESCYRREAYIDPVQGFAQVMA